jgi:hypothetical protein
MLRRHAFRIICRHKIRLIQGDANFNPDNLLDSHGLAGCVSDDGAAHGNNIFMQKFTIAYSQNVRYLGLVYRDTVQPYTCAFGIYAVTYVKSETQICTAIEI